MFCREMDSSNRTETHTSPPLHQIVHLSGSELVQLLDLSSPLKGRFGERACCYRVGDLMACNHRCASSSRKTTKSRKVLRVRFIAMTQFRSPSPQRQGEHLP